MITRLPEGGVGEHQLEGAAESKHHGLVIDLIIFMIMMIFIISVMIIAVEILMLLKHR